MSFTSDQTTVTKTTGAVTLIRAARTRVTSIQGRAEAGSVLLLHDSATTGATAAGNLKATYRWETEGIQLFIPGSGILFKSGIVYNLAGAAGSVTVTITGA